MPTSAATNKPEGLINRLSSSDGEAKLKALRELKNQIIGNRTKKLSYTNIGAVPAVVSILASSVSSSSSSSIIIQSATVIGSFACGVDAGAKAVLDAGAFPILYQLLSHSDRKIVDAAARSLKMIYMSKLAPKYNFSKKVNLDFLLSLLNSESENVITLAAGIITHSCEKAAEQEMLCDAGVLKRLQKLLGGSVNQRDACLESLATLIIRNPIVTRIFVEADGSDALRGVTQLLDDRYPRGRLLAAGCLSAVWNASPIYLKDVGLRKRLISVLLELLSDPGQVGDDSPFAFASLIAQNEDAQKLAFKSGAIEKLCSHLKEAPLPAKRIQGIYLALAELCAKLQLCRSKILSLQEPELVRGALSHDSSEVRIAACICLRNVSRSPKSSHDGPFLNEMIMVPLVHLLNDLPSVQVAALGALSNIVVNFPAYKSVFIRYGGAKQLINLSKLMDSTVRLNAVRCLKNLVFQADIKSKEGIFSELTAPTLSSLICDPENPVKEQALGFLRNLVDGCTEYVDISEDGVILHAVGRQLRSASGPEIYIQGMYVLSNVATGNELHKEAVLHQLVPSSGSDDQSILLKFLQSNDNQLRTAAIWSVVNLTFPSSPGASGRVVILRNAGIYSQIKQMGQDPCLDVKLRARTAIEQSIYFSYHST